jgi:hypothetical protein
VGYCAIDRRREPLTGAEKRDCWTSSAAAGDGGLFGDHVIVAVDPIELVPAPLVEARVTPR